MAFFLDDTFDGIPVKIKVDGGYYDSIEYLLDGFDPYEIDYRWYDDPELFTEACVTYGVMEPYSDVLGIYHAETGELLYDGSRPCFSYAQDPSDAHEVAWEMWHDNEVYQNKFGSKKRAQVYTIDELRAELKSIKRHGGDMQADAIMNMHENDVHYWTGFIAAVDKIEFLIGR